MNEFDIEILIEEPLALDFIPDGEYQVMYDPLRYTVNVVDPDNLRIDGGIIY